MDDVNIFEDVEKEDEDFETLVNMVKRPVKGVRFEVIAKHLWDVNVIKFDQAEGTNSELVLKMENAMKETRKNIDAKPIIKPRPNEVGNAIEPFVQKALIKFGLDARTPITKSGKGKTAGYPDLMIVGQDKHIYLEVKTFSATKEHGFLRSFYLSPSDNPKVIKDGYHLAVGFKMREKDNRYTAVEHKLVDLFGLRCNLKAEFNSNNVELFENNPSLG